MKETPIISYCSGIAIKQQKSYRKRRHSFNNISFFSMNKRQIISESISKTNMQNESLKYEILKMKEKFTE